METKQTDKPQGSSVENSGNKPSTITQLSHQRKKGLELEQIEQKKNQVEKMVRKTIRLCGYESRVEVKILPDEQGNYNKILVFVEQINTEDNQGIFTPDQPALAALGTIIQAAANTNRNEPTIYLTVLPMQDKHQYLHHDKETTLKLQRKVASL